MFAPGRAPRQGARFLANVGEQLCSTHVVHVVWPERLELPKSRDDQLGFGRGELDRNATRRDLSHVFEGIPRRRVATAEPWMAHADKERRPALHDVARTNAQGSRRFRDLQRGLSPRLLDVVIQLELPKRCWRVLVNAGKHGLTCTNVILAGRSRLAAFGLERISCGIPAEFRRRGCLEFRGTSVEASQRDR